MGITERFYYITSYVYVLYVLYILYINISGGVAFWGVILCWEGIIDDSALACTTGSLSRVVLASVQPYNHLHSKGLS